MLQEKKVTGVRCGGLKLKQTVKLRALDRASAKDRSRDLYCVIDALRVVSIMNKLDLAIVMLRN